MCTCGIIGMNFNASDKSDVWRDERRATYCSGEYLQPPEAHVRRHVGWGVENQQRDRDEAEVDEEGENVEQEEPLEEQEVGEDAAAERAAYLFHGALPQLQGLPGRAQAVAEPAERLRETSPESDGMARGGHVVWWWGDTLTSDALSVQSAKHVNLRDSLDASTWLLLEGNCQSMKGSVLKKYIDLPLKGMCQNWEEAPERPAVLHGALTELMIVWTG